MMLGAASRFQALITDNGRPWRSGRNQFCPKAVNRSWPIAGSVRHVLTVAEDDYHIASSVTEPLKQGCRQGIRDESLGWGKRADTSSRCRHAFERQRWALWRRNEVYLGNTTIRSDRHWGVDQRAEGTKSGDSQSHERHGQKRNQYGHATLHPAQWCS
jgi:hypothetical protein